MRDDRRPPLLEVRNLRAEYASARGAVYAINGVSLSVGRGEVLALVGESGSGKSATSLSIMGLLPRSGGRVVQGQVIFDGKDLLQLPEQQLRRLRGGEIAMVFQNPMTTLNPTLTVGKQLQEIIRLHTELSKAAARQRAIELLSLVEIPEPAARMHSYPHQLSGGLRQRVMIALALSCEPKLLIADEATTALDVTTQAQILHLLKRITADSHTAMLVVTHNMGVVAGLADRVAVMYAGRIVEMGDVKNIFYRPKHPYTVGLLGSIPRLDSPRSQELLAIEGRPPTLLSQSLGCPFRDRCWLAMDVCASADPQDQMVGAADAHLSACWAEIADVRKPLAGVSGQLAATRLETRSETNE